MERKVYRVPCIKLQPIESNPYMFYEGSVPDREDEEEEGEGSGEGTISASTPRRTWIDQW